MQREVNASETSKTAAPDGRGRPTWWAWCLWLPACVGFGVLLGWASFEVAGYFSPLLIFPLLIGLLLGAALVALMRIGQMGHRPTAWVALGLSAAAVVVGQHYFSYRAAVAEADRTTEKFQKAQAAFGALVQGSLPPRPTGLVDYMRRQARQGRELATVLGSYSAKGPIAWLCWAVDGLLVLLPAVVMVAFALRRPFCGQCGSWYATRRSGRLDAEALRRLAEELGLAVADSAPGGYYRLLCCNQGCAPSGFSLSWEEPPSVKESRIAWLDDRRRNRVVQILDASRKPPKT